MSADSSRFVLLYLCIISTSIIRIQSQTCSNGLTSPRAITHNAIGNDIEWQQVSTNTYSTTLIFDVSTQTFDSVNAEIRTRLHNDSLPSPTLRFERGKQYQVTLINNLGPESVNNPTEHNVQKDPNTTNLHTHGLHISGMSPGDNVFIKLLPGEQHTYIYNVPCNHSGGTHWYHPHHHGSIETQASMGAAGALIIEDDAIDENLPNWYVDMQELIFFVTHLNLARVDNRYDPTVDYVWSWTTPNPGPPGETDLYLVNGEYQPNICMTAGEWIKFRFAQVETQVPRTYYIGNGECAIYLLAIDGVIVHGLDDTDVPRLVDAVWLAQPSRADVALFCPGDESGDITYDIWVNNDNDIQVIATIQVIGTATSPVTTLTPFTPSRPRYLENLLDGYYSGDLPTQMYQNGQGNDIDYWEDVRVTGTSIDRVEFVDETSYLQNIEINTINTWEVTNGGTALHPFHVHVNHFQVNSTLPAVAEDPDNQQYYPPSGYQEVGDFQDSIWGPGWIRFKTDLFAGTVTMHCHILRHEDEGAMGTVEIINGCDNSYNDYVGTVDTCDYIDTCGQFADTSDPTGTPTKMPTSNPSELPTEYPTASPLLSPTQSPIPSQSPTENPSEIPTQSPTQNPVGPSKFPTVSPTANPTSQTLQPTSVPTYVPTAIEEAESMEAAALFESAEMNEFGELNQYTRYINLVLNVSNGLTVWILLFAACVSFGFWAAHSKRTNQQRVPLQLNDLP